MSVQVDAAQIPPLQIRLMQSAPTRHIFPAAHFMQPEPPQSWSVSGPFLTVSKQVGVAHRLLKQTELVQSLPARHIWPGMHLGQRLPPQSVSVSLPSLRWSMHDELLLQRLLAQMPLAQSPATRHILP